MLSKQPQLIELSFRQLQAILSAATAPDMPIKLLPLLIFYLVEKNYNIFQPILCDLQSSSVQWMFKCVKGHQDELQDFESLSCNLQLNVLVDFKAKEIVIQAVENNQLQEYRH